MIIESYLGGRDDENLSLLISQFKDMPVYYVKRYRREVNITGVKLINKNSFSYIFLMHTSSHILTNSRLHNTLEKRDGQTVIQMWHGVPWKKLVYDQSTINFFNQDAKQYLENFSEDVAKWDYLWVPSEYAKRHLLSAFRYKGNLIENMYPADKEMLKLKDNLEYKANLYKKLKIKENKKNVLYMPTFREDKMSDNRKYSFYTNLELETLAIKLSNYQILIRGHYLVQNDILSKFDNIINVSEHASLVDLYLISDILITDYSSAVYSFSLLEKPIVSIQFDIEEYKALRGLYSDGINNMNITMINNLEEFNNLNFENLKKSTPKQDYFN